MYMSAEYNVYPPEIEEGLTDHSAVEQSMVIGIKHDTWAEAGHECILRSPPVAVYQQMISKRTSKQNSQIISDPSQTRYR